MCLDHQFGWTRYPRGLTLWDLGAKDRSLFVWQALVGSQGPECTFALILSQEGPVALITSLDSSSVVQSELALSRVSPENDIIHVAPFINMCGERAVLCDVRTNLFVGRCRLRCDNEPSIMAVAERVKAKMTDGVVVETSPRHSSASSLAERDIRTIGEQLRTLRYDTQNRHKTRSTADPVIWPWVVGYAGFLCHDIRTWSLWHHTVQGSV